MEDFLVEMGVSGLTGRLKRLNDLFVYQTKEFYDEYNIDIEPNWHMIFLMLEKHNNLTVSEISESIHISHPAVIKLIGKMKKNGYIESFQDPDDLRKQQLKLSKKAIGKMPQLKKYWEAGEKSLNDLLNESEALLFELEQLENNLQLASFKDRMKDYLKT
ncbi:MarR family winged helix-turn-helix transcriptional regulator [Galbibacter sp.]|jgi:DNA-binding MarR family transcriptional regulator|uniref:MarR family winged helix-turn-helix transcriptional regulator n=1 Tax=Galbibacter sp. TaxID=2918471 RepID=UPI003A8D63C4